MAGGWKCPDCGRTSHMEALGVPALLDRLFGDERFRQRLSTYPDVAPHLRDRKSLDAYLEREELYVYPGCMSCPSCGRPDDYGVAVSRAQVIDGHGNELPR